jgi:N-acetylmuramoyl-L-alanine amidase
MKKHIIQRGECLSSLAEKYGFHDPDVLHSLPENSELKATRKNPNLLCKGDKVKIKDKVIKYESGADAQKHRFKVKGLRTWLRFMIEDFDGNALANKKYQLDIGSDSYSGMTAGDGLIEHRVMASETRGTLTVWIDDSGTNSLVWPLEVGHLEPYDTNRGIQARLNNLGFGCGEVDGIIGPKTRAAAKAFKKKNGLADNDTIDTTTKNKLKDVYGF